MGADPLEHLFEMCAQRWDHASARRHEWRGLAMYGVDGSTLRVADSAQNRAHCCGAEGRGGDSGYPIVRLATLTAVRSHLLAAAAYGRFEDSGIALASSLWREVPANAVVLVGLGLPRGGHPGAAYTRRQGPALDERGRNL